MHHTVNKTQGIITLYRHQRAAFAITSKRGPTPKAPKTSATELPPGSTISADNDEVQRTPEGTSSSLSSDQQQVVCKPFLYVFLKSKKQFLVQRRGAEFALTTIARHFGADINKCLPYLWENTVGPLKAVVMENLSIGTLGLPSFKLLRYSFKSVSSSTSCATVGI